MASKQHRPATRELEQKNPHDPIRRDEGRYEDFQQTLDAGHPDYALVALAIGKWASRGRFSGMPPQWVMWAIEASVALHEHSQDALGPVVGKYKRRRSKRDEQNLAAVADIMIDVDAKLNAGFDAGEKVSARAAIHRVLGIPSGDLNNIDASKLQVLWRRDSRHQIRRANLRLAAKFRARGWLR